MLEDFILAMTALSTKKHLYLYKAASSKESVSTGDKWLAAILISAENVWTRKPGDKLYVKKKLTVPHQQEASSANILISNHTMTSFPAINNASEQIVRSVCILSKFLKKFCKLLFHHFKLHSER